jgi:hypothetical protein
MFTLKSSSVPGLSFPRTTKGHVSLLSRNHVLFVMTVFCDCGLWTSAEVEISSLPCVIKEAQTGGFVHRISSRDGARVTLEVTRRRPSIPICVSHSSWTHHLWWNSPSDNNKLVSAILDAFAKKERTSEFELRGAGQKPTSGCVLLLALFGVIGMSLGVLLVTGN